MGDIQVETLTVEGLEKPLEDLELHIKAAMTTGDVNLWIKVDEKHKALVAACDAQAERLGIAGINVRDSAMRIEDYVGRIVRQNQRIADLEAMLRRLEYAGGAHATEAMCPLCCASEDKQP